MFKTGFYQDSDQGRNRIWVWGVGFLLMWLGIELFDAAALLLYQGLLIAFDPGPGVAFLKKLKGLSEWGGLWDTITATLFTVLIVWFSQHKLRQRPLSKIVNAGVRFRWRRMVAAIIAFAIVTCILWVAYFLITEMRKEPSIFGNSFESERADYLMPSFLDSLNWSYLLISILFMPVYYFFEEMFFRGFLDQGLRKHLRNKALAFLVSGFLFGLCYAAYLIFSTSTYSNSGGLNAVLIVILSYAVFGVAMSVITDRDQGIEAAIGFAIAYYFYTNFVSGFLLFKADLMMNSDFELPPAFTVIHGLIYLPAVIILIPCTFGLQRRVRADEK